jgi:hypothetical protein
MPSSVTPPVDDNVASLFLSDTFYTWFNVSNDMVNKINPIEVYSITADTADYLSGSQKDGILITDNGNGNYNIGLQLPANITGGITWHGDHVFNAGISGNVVNNVNGRTGAVDAVQTVSGYTAEFSGFTGNIPGAVFSINGVTATATGSMTLDVADIAGIATTGGIGTILAATGGGTGSYSKRVELFTTTPEEDQTAIRIKGTTGDLAQVGFGTSSLTASARLHIAQGGMSNGIRIVNNVDNGPDIYMTARGHIQADNEIKFLTGFNAAANTHPFEFKVGNNTGQTHEAMDSIFRMKTDGVDFNNKVYTQGNAAGAADKILVSDANDKLTFANGLESILGMFAGATVRSVNFSGAVDIGDIIPIWGNSSFTYNGTSDRKYFVFMVGKYDYDGNAGEQTGLNFAGIKSGGDTTNTTGDISITPIHGGIATTGTFYFGVAIRIA